MNDGETNERIGKAPAQLLFGNLIHLDRGILLPNLPATREDKEFMFVCLGRTHVRKPESFAGHRPKATTSS